MKGSPTRPRASALPRAFSRYPSGAASSRTYLSDGLARASNAYSHHGGALLPAYNLVGYPDGDPSKKTRDLPLDIVQLECRPSR
jgi:hypothetical protein